MKTIKAMIWFFVIALVLGIGVFGMPQATNAQAGKETKESKQAPDDDKDDGEKLSRKEAKKAKITMEAARAIALNRVSGTITEEDLEKENGRLQYAFDIRTADGKVVDVEIDAMTGEILKADDDDAEDDDDASEKISAADAKQAKISMDAARAIALNGVSGTIVEEELEKEKGRLQYSFDIRDRNGKIWDVEVDAITGEVLQAVEDDEDNDNEQGRVSKAKKSVYRAAVTVKNATVKTVGKLF